MRASYSLLKKLEGVDLPLKEVLHTFDTLVLPILTYGAPLFAPQEPSNLKKLDVVRIRFLKRYYNLRFRTRSHIIYGECGVIPVSMACDLEAIRYWQRLIIKPEEHPAKIVYNVMLEKHRLEGAENNYCTHMQNMMSKYNLTSHWRSQQVRCAAEFVRKARKNIETFFWTEWARITEQSSYGAAGTYAQLQKNQMTSLLPVHYYVLKSRKLERALIAFISGNAGFLNEKLYPLFDDAKFCFNCIGKLDSLYHALCECKLYDDIRNVHIPNIKQIIPSPTHLNRLFEPIEVARIAKNLAIFAHKALKIRSRYSMNITQDYDGSITVRVVYT